MTPGADIKTDHTARACARGPASAPVPAPVPASIPASARDRVRPRVPYALGAAVLCAAFALTGCSLLGAGSSDTSADDKAVPATEPATVRPALRPVAPVPTVLEGVHVNVEDGAVVGVGMPVSLTFEQPVPAAERAAVERALTITSRPPVTGAWSWVKDRHLDDGQRLDYRPRTYWTPGTKVTLRAGPGARSGKGSGPAGTLNRRFSVGRSLVATVDVPGHFMTVVKRGVATRIPITAGAPGMETWNGVMVVSDKERRVLMDSSTVGFGDAYKGYYNYAVHLTSSGTYLHENPLADVHAGRENITHGCVGLPTDGTARRFFEEVIPGDVVQVTGSPETVDPGNGYGDWNIPWSRWLAGSALR
ncbi:Ig-like domain-containing protein [Streptomyces sp. NPDC127033]|uniref:L,D-transpeptidase n=1 Tax=Streptomyces sp. NPDC127033 TaxID=3347110 RepID=UPI00365F9878